MSEYLCKDCKHSFRTVKLVLAHGFNSQYSRLCRLSYKEAHIEKNPVVGDVHHKAEYENCSSYRIRSADCGPDAKFWQPKGKKDLFKFITKVST